ncbi:hypothetical protein AG1IA_02779 [Rhizoctonia solani AG-1 IA]|uniref:Uncharacterized protein n=1 Tax=Thanatephorus cucumeris (strain AG1-IA) TaxID=983506 RepID=L8X256_THACA|nr:hypothetical protein AG1IA_02779 [Rhizoctonia solani AG-1 IA]
MCGVQVIPAERSGQGIINWEMTRFGNGFGSGAARYTALQFMDQPDGGCGGVFCVQLEIQSGNLSFLDPLALPDDVVPSHFANYDLSCSVTPLRP